MSRHDWLLLIHVAGAFCLLAGALLAVVLSQAALRRSRPSEVALLLGLIRVAVVLIGVGMLLTLVFGLWLVKDTAYDLGDGWIDAALGLWVAALALGAVGGRRDRRTREFAEQLAAAGDEPSDELEARLGDPVFARTELRQRGGGHRDPGPDDLEAGGLTEALRGPQIAIAVGR